MRPLLRRAVGPGSFPRGIISDFPTSVQRLRRSTPSLYALGLSILNRIIASATSARGAVYLRMSLAHSLGISLLRREEAYPLPNQASRSHGYRFSILYLYVFFQRR